MDSLYKNLVIVDKDSIRKGSLLIGDGIIRKVLDGDEAIDNVEVIDCSNLMVLPGFIDLHSHLRDPGLTYKEDIESGLHAAAKGGFTTVCAMANTKPVIARNKEVIENINKAKALELTDLIQLAALSYDFGDKLTDFDSLSGIIPLVSNDGQNIDNIELMSKALRASEKTGIRIATHNEPEAETVIRDLALQEKLGGKLHICHVSLKDTIDAITQAKEKGQDVTCEVTPHHIAIEEADFKVHPPFRGHEHVQRLIEAIKNDEIDAIATDHAPHSKEDKANGSPGLIGYETAFGVVNKIFRENDISYPTLAKLTSYNPGNILGIPGGSIKEGAHANLVIVDPNEKWIVKEDEFISKSKNTPFIGKELLGKVHRTLNRGKIIYDSGKINHL